MNIIKYGLSGLLLASTTAILSGCASNSEQKQCCSIDWYLSHDTSRAEKLARCSRIGAEAIGQSCSNAMTAEKILSGRQRSQNLSADSTGVVNL